MKILRLGTLAIALVMLFFLLNVYAATTNSEPTIPISKKVYLPIVFHDARLAPPATTSRYMATVDYNTLYNEGCSQGSSGQNGLVVLNFGQPQFDGMAGAYGTLLFDNVTFASDSQIENAAEEFLAGYWDCSSADANLTLAIGTNNYLGETTNGHGAAWAQMVNDVGAWINTPPSYASKETIAGGSDMEMDWNTSTNTRAWADGYNSVYQYYYYDFGSCDGCGSATYPQACPNQVPDNGWSVDDVWYVSWYVHPAFPLPEIYATNGLNARQWYCMSLYAYNNHGLKMNIKGSFTQWQACKDRPQNNCHLYGTDSTPSAGWSQLWIDLNADSRTAQDVPW